MTLTFFVPGRPVPQGSSRAFVVTPRATGRPRAVVTHDNPQTRPWRDAIGNAAQEMMRKAGWRMGTEAVTLNVTFVMPRPKRLSAKKPTPRHTTRPDRDKLLRALGDALEGIVYADDAQVDSGPALKRYAEPGEMPGVHVSIESDGSVHERAGQRPTP